jgi:hypothetical protein
VQHLSKTLAYLPVEFSSLIHPIGFEFPAWVSLHVQPISIQVLTLGSSLKLNSMSHLIEEGILT